MKFLTKTFTYIFLSTGVVIAGISVATHFWIVDYHIKENIRYEKELVTLVALKSEDYILRNDPVELYKFYQSIVKVDPYIEYIFAEKGGDILVHTFMRGVPKGLLGFGLINDSSQVDIVPIENNRGDLIYHLRRGIGSPVHATLHFGVSQKKVRESLRPHRNLLLTIGLLLLATVPFGLAFFLTRLVSKPLFTLRKGVTRIGSGELSYRFNMRTGDEIEKLTNEINTMAGSLEQLRDGLKAEIAERTQAENALAKQTELLDNILNTVPHNVFWKDRQSVFLGCNIAFAQTLGLKHPDEIIGKTDYDLIKDKTEAAFYCECDKKVMNTGRPMYDIEETLTHSGGLKKSIVTSKVPLKDQDGKVAGILGIFYDITERKQLEESIKQAQKMEAIGTLAGGIAHDFNNILGSIIGYSELASDDMAPDSPGHDYLQQVLKSAFRAKELIRQILTFSRKGQEERKPINMVEVVKEEAKLLRSTLPTTIEIKTTIDENAGIVNADLTQMHQIVMNLCTNAAQAMHENSGLLEIDLTSTVINQETSRKKHHHISPGPFVKLKISDTGSGIDSRIIHRIFDPFFTTKEKDKGTGMGLAVVHGIVKEHGGDIAVESRPGNGTSFTVLLPKVVLEPGRLEDIAVDLPSGNERILFVDDEKILLDLVKKMLSSLGYHVTTLNSSLEALEAYRAAPDSFDIVITDQTMPHMTGFMLAGEILKINPNAAIILCTGYSDAISSEKTEAAGIKALLYKPISKAEFADVIRMVLDG